MLGRVRKERLICSNSDDGTFSSAPMNGFGVLFESLAEIDIEAGALYCFSHDPTDELYLEAAFFPLPCVDHGLGEEVVDEVDGSGVEVGGDQRRVEGICADNADVLEV